ncbi:outer membrane porin [Denitrovibrio acetiphilus DSM 12809]|uniref:Outer membrane porin n=1 Tax=Denitrovibrio acetiphilus (strain DSM 12809 / NBRC 114555 / N2460) TaxID=522772 RepID=D4H272_DENA2|nr:OprD family outer membrane porin [Denitrovibrio acetiphilus]ADD68863.1 outer membrane porin [Denitrovibrio acetiphilus DSM 12809]
MRFLNLVTMLVLIMTSSIAYSADTLAEAFSKGTLKGELRTFYFERDFDEATTDRADFAVGSLLYYKTAPLHGISAGLAFASSNDLGSDEDKNVYGLLATGDDGDHESYTRMQEYYIQGEWFDTVVKYGAQEINTPFMNKHDIRMSPKTYKGLSLVNNSVNGLTLSGYYITEFMGWNDDEFMSISESAGAGDDDSALLVGGIKYQLPVSVVKASVAGWQYYLEDVFQSTYFEGSVGKKIGDYNLHITPSYLTQKSQGDELVGDFDTTQYGFNAGVAAYGLSLTGFYARTPDDGVFAPWGDGKVIIQQIIAAGRADEDAYAVKLGYNFGALGLRGLDAYVFYGMYDTPESGAAASSDIDETDFSLQYKFDEDSYLKGFSVRVRYAIIDQDTAEDYNDFRVYIKYSFALSGK